MSEAGASSGASSEWLRAVVEGATRLLVVWMGLALLLVVGFWEADRVQREVTAERFAVLEPAPPPAALAAEQAAQHTALRNRFVAFGSLAAGLATVFAVASAVPSIRRRRGTVEAVPFGVVAALVLFSTATDHLSAVEARIAALSGMLADRLALLAPDRIADTVAALGPAWAEVTAVALMKNGWVVFLSNPGAFGREAIDWTRTHIVELGIAAADQAVVAWSVWRALFEGILLNHVKDQTVLCFAIAFLAATLVQLAAATHARLRTPLVVPLAVAGSRHREQGLEAIRPVFLLAVFAESLAAAFLPALLKQSAAASGLPAQLSSLLFTAYFLGFALTLVPAGQSASRQGPKPVIVTGLALAGAALVLPVVSLDFVSMLLSRLFAGIGQGMVLIGVQTYVLEVASAGAKTRGAAIIVYGFNGGMIAGLALGSLMVGPVGTEAIFLVGALTAFAAALFTAAVIPPIRSGVARDGGLRQALRELGRTTARALSDPGFLKVTALIGIPAKAVLTGVILYALPLLLTERGMAAGNIGQVIIFYAAGVLAASTVASRLVDRIGRSDVVLTLGAIASGAGLVLVGLTGTAPAAGGAGHGPLATAVLVAAVLLTGLAHGCINAPVVTHVAELGIAREVGSSRVAATYRFLERIGHVSGPVVVAQLYAVIGDLASVLVWIGIGLVVAAGVFLLPLGQAPRVSPARG